MVTAHHRHGHEVYKGDLTELSNRQIEVEDVFLPIEREALEKLK